MGLLKTLLSRALHIAKEIEFLIKSNYRVRKSHQRIYEQNFFCKKKKRKYRHNWEWQNSKNRIYGTNIWTKVKTRI